MAGGALAECLDFFFLPGDLGVAGVGCVPGLADSVEAVFEFFAEPGVGAGAEERGAVDAGFASEGLDVAFPAGREVAAQQLVHGLADAGFAGVPLLGAEPHGQCSGLVVAGGAAASMAAITRTARSYSACSRARSVVRVR